MVPTFFALLVIVAALCANGDRMPRALMLSCLFGASAAIHLPALGGAPVMPAIMLLPFVMWRALQEHGVNAMIRPLAYPQAGFWLLLLVLWGVISAFFVPRLFDGETMLFATDRVMQGIRLVPLQPLTTNLTQSAYAVAGLCLFASMSALLQPAPRMLRFRDAVLLLASVNVGAALLNLAELHLGIPSLLELVRNAGYAIMVGGEVGGLQRISGTFSETSAFSSFTLPLVAFCASLWRDGVRPGYSGTVALLMLALLLLSTSSTAYAGLAVYAALMGAAMLWQAVSRSNSLRLGGGAWLLWGVSVAASLVLLARPELADRAGEFFGVTLLNKLDSSSGIERGSWNLQAWQNFTDLYGLGTGLGSARASSFPLVLLSNVGVLGTALFLAFAARVLLSRLGAAAQEIAPVVRASRHAVLGALIAVSVSATVFDLGLAFYAFAAAAAAHTRTREPLAAQPGAHHALA